MFRPYISFFSVLFGLSSFKTLNKVNYKNYDNSLIRVNIAHMEKISWTSV